MHELTVTYEWTVLKNHLGGISIWRFLNNLYMNR
jgi:hypothetical protein